MDADEQQESKKAVWEQLLAHRTELPPPHSAESFGLYLNYVRLWRLFPDVDRRALHTLLCACGGSLVRTVDNMLLARRLRHCALGEAEERQRGGRTFGRRRCRGLPGTRTIPAAACNTGSPKAGRWTSGSLSGGSVSSCSPSSGERNACSTMKPFMRKGPNVSPLTKLDENELDKFLASHTQVFTFEQSDLLGHLDSLSSLSYLSPGSSSYSSLNSQSSCLPSMCNNKPCGNIVNSQVQTKISETNIHSLVGSMLGESSSGSDSSWQDISGFSEQAVFLNDVKELDHEDMKSIIDLTQQMDAPLEYETEQLTKAAEDEDSNGELIIDTSDEDKNIIIL